MALKDLQESKENLDFKIQDHNDKVGAEFQQAVETFVKSYKQGVIHHKQFIEHIKKCVEQAENVLA